MTRTGKSVGETLERAAEVALTATASAILFILMLLTCADVVGRYFINKPIYGGLEVTELLLAALIFMALPLVSLKGQHVTVDLFETVTPGWLFRIQHISACLLGAVCTGYLAWRLGLRARDLVQAGETTAQLQIRLGWFTYGMAFFMGMNTLAMLVLAGKRPTRSNEIPRLDT